MSERESRICSLAHDGEVVRAVQITDTHLCAQPGGTLLSMDTDHSLQAVINLVARRQPDIDLVLGTGDLADGGAAGAYRRLRDYFGQLGGHSFCLPGNHDDREHMAAELGEYPALAAEIRVAGWQVLMLDSQIPGEVGGQLGPQQLASLDARLAHAGEAGLHSLVCLHHHPLFIGSEWLDEQVVADSDAFFSILDRHRSPRGVLWGHIHQQVDWVRNGVRLMATPSTCVQFAPGSEQFSADDLAPGYRWLDLHPDGRIESDVVRVDEVRFQVDLDSGGYL